MNISSVNPIVIPAGVTQTTTPAQTPEQASDRSKLVQAVKTVNDTKSFGENSELTFVLDPTTRRTLTRVIDSQTKEVLMQIPPEYVIRMAEELKQNASS